MHLLTPASTALFLLSTLASAHMEMKTPYAIRSKYDPKNGENDKDYSMTGPLKSDGSDFPCKGYQNHPSRHTTATYTAGATYPFELAGSATHDGGSCQLSLSYDNAKTFRVIQSMIGKCPPSMNPSWNFTIPASAPNGTALLAWNWNNKVGNREAYMNCAQVDIVSATAAAAPAKVASGNGTSAATAIADTSSTTNTTHNAGAKRNPLRRHAAQPHYRTHLPRARAHEHTSSPRAAPVAFADLPYIWKANIPSVTNCTTLEGEEPVYPHPGPVVVYAGSMTPQSAVTDGVCDAAGPVGPTFMA